MVSLWTEVVSAVIIVGSVRHKNVARAADLIIIVGVYIMLLHIAVRHAYYNFVRN